MSGRGLPPFGTRTVLLDGGMGSALIARGLEQGRPPETWNVEQPHHVEAVHATYLAAGSDVIQTNTFGGNPITLATHRLAARMAELNQAGARVAGRAVEAAGGQRWVAGNIGPSGTFLPPVGSAVLEELEEAFAAQAAALVEGGVDYLAVETMVDLREALAAVRGIRRACDLPVTVCLTFDRKKRGYFTLMGDRPADAARALAEAGAAAVGANCSLGSDAMLELEGLLTGAVDVPVILKPNAGLPELVDGHPVYRQAPEEFAADMAVLARRGVAAVGGCCGTDHRFLAALRAALDGSVTTTGSRPGVEDEEDRGHA